MVRKEYAHAADFYSRALRQTGLPDVEQAPLWNKLGIAYQQLTDYDACRKAYKQAMKRRADFAEPWNNLGTTYYLQEKYRKSLKYYLHAIKQSPDSAAFHLNLGSSYFRMKKYEKALVEYRTALTLDPECLRARSTSGTVMQAGASDPEYYFYLAKTFALLGRAPEAVQYLRRAFEDGFKDQKRLDEDPDFQKLSKFPAYVELRKNPPVPITD